MSLTLERHTDPQLFSDLFSEWHELLAKCRSPRIFQTPEFTKSWWETLGTGDLTLITWRDEAGVLVGLAPLFATLTEQGKTLSFLGCSDVTDYQDLLVDQTASDAVYASFFAYLESPECSGTTLKLCSLPNDSVTLLTMKERYNDSKLVISQQDVVPLLPLPNNWDDYLNQLDRKQRHEIRRKWGKLEREVAFAFSLVTESSQTATAITTFIELHKASSPGKSRFWDDHHVAFFTKVVHAFATAGWLKLFFLAIEGRPAAAMLVFDYGDRYYLYNSGYDPEYYRELSTGNTLLAYTIKHAIEQERPLYDFLRGDEAYKFRFGATPEPVWDAELRAQ